MGSYIWARQLVQAVFLNKHPSAMTRIAPLVAALVASTVAQQQDPGVIRDPGTYGPQVEIAHLYYDQWPTGKAFHNQLSIY